MRDRGGLWGVVWKPRVGEKVSFVFGLRHPYGGTLGRRKDL